MALVGGELDWKGVTCKNCKTGATDVMPSPDTIGKMGQQFSVTAQTARSSGAAVSTEMKI